MSSKRQTERFNDLYLKWGEALYRYSYYHLGNKEGAEDLVQEIFVKLWDKLDDVNEGKEKSYLYTMAKNYLINKGEHQKVVLKFVSQIVVQNQNETPQYILEINEFRDKLMKAIADLPDGQREVFLMNRIEGLKYREIADRLSLSQKAVEKRMHQALIELRKISSKI